MQLVIIDRYGLSRLKQGEEQCINDVETFKFVVIGVKMDMITLESGSAINVSFVIVIGYHHAD